MVRFFPVRRCSCWHLVPRKAFILRRATPTRPGFPWSVGAHVGALFPAKPLSFVGSRQHGPDFPGPPAPLLAPCSPQALIPPSGRANMARISPVHRCPCCYNFRKRRRKGGAAHHLFFFFTSYGAGEGNRTLDASLGSSSFAIKLHPQNLLAYYTPITNSRQTFWFDGCSLLINSTALSCKISYA